MPRPRSRSPARRERYTGRRQEFSPPRRRDRDEPHNGYRASERSPPWVRPPDDRVPQQQPPPPYGGSGGGGDGHQEGTRSVHSRLNHLETMVSLLAANQKRESCEMKPPDLSGGNIPELVPRNPYFTTSMWINLLEAESVRRNMTERDTIAFVEGNMTGVVKAWYNSVAHCQFSWPELRLLIVETFPDNKNFARTLLRLVQRSKDPGEPWINYFFCKLYLLEACKILGPDAVLCMVEGFGNEAMQEQAMKNNYQTPESLYSEFMVYLPGPEPPVKQEFKESSGNQSMGRQDGGRRQSPGRERRDLDGDCRDRITKKRSVLRRHNQ